MRNSSETAKLIGELDVINFDLGKARMILKTLPEYWSLLPLVIRIPMMIEFSIARR